VSAKENAGTLIVIGAHRDELAFGERVVARMDPGRYRVLRIQRGLFGQRPPRLEELAAYRDRHQALYRQILEHVAPGQRLMIDLHSGIDSAGLSADVLCADTRLLACLARRLKTNEPGTAAVRLIRLVASTESPDLSQPDRAAWLVAKPDLPEEVWNRDELLYVGVEVYLRREGLGLPVEWAFARTVLGEIAACGHESGPARAITPKRGAGAPSR